MIQNSISVNETTKKVTGSVIYQSEGLSPAGPLSGAGFFLSLKLSSDDWDQYDSVYVGLDPSYGTGLVRIDEDPDHQVTMKLSVEGSEAPFSWDPHQKFVVVAYGGNTSVRTEYMLNVALVAIGG